MLSIPFGGKLEIAQLFGGEIQMLPERKGNRMTAEVVTKKTEALGWKAKRHIKEFIEELRSVFCDY